MDEWLTTAEACTYLKVHRRTLYRMMEEGRLPFYRIAGGQRRIKREDLDALMVPGEAKNQRAAQG